MNSEEDVLHSLNFINNMDLEGNIKLSIEEIKIIEENIEKDIKELENLIPQIIQKMSFNVYDGITGVAFIYLKLYQYYKDEKYLKNSENYLSIAMEKYGKKEHDYPGLLGGNCGIYLVAVLIYHEKNDKESVKKYVKLFVESEEDLQDNEHEVLNCWFFNWNKSA
eukprot:TRINITY_DN10887_c0_g1_i2.p1 TRINITY_DN10887_c0_g1~~TRINITY_DN10887_c0_g1_i2.p1  ORF type:complete len:165 (-),score=42.21 TRINITY_DN10887_c0_g1_i2:530-1024(-)